jgi:hypothetical protein
MLEFIVLGKVPGTQFEITFNGVLVATGAILIIVELALFYRHYKNSRITPTQSA